MWQLTGLPACYGAGLKRQGVTGSLLVLLLLLPPSSFHSHILSPVSLLHLLSYRLRTRPVYGQQTAVKFTLELYSFFNLGARWGRRSTPHLGHLTPGKDPIPIVQEAGWAPWPVWTGAENLAHTGIRSTDRTARSSSLYRLSYRGPQQTEVRFGIISTTAPVTPNLAHSVCFSSHRDEECYTTSVIFLHVERNRRFGKTCRLNLQAMQSQGSIILVKRTVDTKTWK